jgi:hypothetical protein
VAQTAGFQIPDFETIDPISGDQIKEGDLVLGSINQTFEDGALHGVWVKWDSVKAQLLQELKGEIPAGGFASGASVSGTMSDSTPFSEKVKNGLFSLGIFVKDGLTTIKELAAEKLTVKIARVEQLEMVDKTNGQIYCTWVQDGEWQKAKGECGSVEVAMAPVQQAQEKAAQAQEIIEQVKEDLSPKIESRVQIEVQEQIEQQVQEEIQEQVAAEVKEEVQEEVAEQLEAAKPDEVINEKPEKEEKKIDEPAPVIEEPIQETPQPSPVDVVVQETEAALMDGASRLLAWAAEALIPIVKKSTAGLMGPFQDLRDFITKKY